MPPILCMRPRPSFPGGRSARGRRVFRSLALGLLTLICTAALVAPADAAANRLTARDGHTASTGSVGTLTNGTARAAFKIPGKRAATVTVGLEVRRHANGDRYRVRAP